MQRPWAQPAALSSGSRKARVAREGEGRGPRSLGGAGRAYPEATAGKWDVSSSARKGLQRLKHKTSRMKRTFHLEGISNSLAGRVYTGAVVFIAALARTKAEHVLIHTPRGLHAVKTRT